MAEETIADTAKALKELAEAVPVYQDAVQPTAKNLGTALAPAGHEIGRAVTTATKAVNIVLAPLHVMVWGWEKIEQIVLPELARRFEAKLQKLVTPKPSVAGPALEALRYAGSDPTLRDMYVNLLATSMDAETAHNAHPAFVEVIKQLTPDEAKLLTWLRLNDGVSVTQVGEPLEGLVIEHIGKPAGCEYLGLTSSYLDNLDRLGIISWESNAVRIGQDRQMVIDAGEWDGPSRVFYLATLTHFGKQFCAACVEA
jgi:hypothetical protein